MNDTEHAASRSALGNRWMLFAGVAKIQTEDCDQAVQWLRRSIDTNPDSAWAYFHLGAALHPSGTAEARMETKPGFCLIPRYRSLAFSDHRRYPANRGRTIQALVAAGVPEGRKVSREESS
jgi:hypothetical protein